MFLSLNCKKTKFIVTKSFQLDQISDLKIEGKSTK
ncbi:hypothetical protein BBR47_47420 [Brevibacillus brevis NBRC 100599]|uniref:Uncharacterized protein n=1 Tax=Brevibacillus brevis (strain 47 / JCM 6285 / NBRC 100599) TaxID=358681 RepID=C0ZKP2_BREBN|nr:hypothetical protein BBR47_47420 [Brevibacillus brevis NBRC 100599]